MLVSEHMRQRSRGRRSPVIASRTSMRFDPLTPIGEWKAVGVRLGVHAEATCWWLGDWLAFGQMKYGRHYKEGVALTGLDYQTLRNYAVVARRFELSRRRDALSFQHHAEVCALCDHEQEWWLDRAAAHGWSRNELRRRVRGAGTRRPAPDEVLRLAVGPGQAERWREAAQRSECAFEAWAMRVLDEAASAVVGD
jgi:hypothetical protein